MKISHFTHEALFNKDCGYYRTKNPLADFVTSPEISQVFGELLAAYILQISSAKKNPISFVEMGAGKGTLFYDILTTIKNLAEKKNPQAVDFLKRAEFHIIEINPVLKKIQQEKLHEFSVKWHESFEEFLNPKLPEQNPKLPERSRGVGTQTQVPSTLLGELKSEFLFISNELFDCFPIDQFVKTDIGWCERLVKIPKQVRDDNPVTTSPHHHSELVSGSFFLANFDPQIHQFVQNLVKVDVPFGAVFEHSKAAQKFMSQLCQALQTHGGIAINFDYGYFKNEFANTLQAIKNHKKVSVLESVGEADITAHVDFAALDKIVKNFNLNSSLITQREFLLSLGIENRREKLIAKNPAQARGINSAIDRLIAPDQMGDLFKCHIFWKS